MYAALWRVLPGPAWLRVTILAVAAVAVIAGLFLWVFPFISDLVVGQDVTVG